MKKIIFILLLLPTLMFSQRSAKVWWFDVGAKVQTGFTGLYNQVVADDGMWAYDPGSGTSFGGKLGINYDVHGFTIDAMFGSSTNKFENATLSKDAEVTLNVTDLYVLYRNNKSLGYFEIGPKLSMINKVENSLLESSDVTNQYAGNALGAVLGFGVYFLGSDGAMSGILGLRFEYGFTDIVEQSDATVGPVAPINDVSFAYTGSDSGTTHPIFAGLVFELNFGLGYFGRAGCGRRSKFIKF